MANADERFFIPQWDGRSTKTFEDCIPGLRAGSVPDILGLLQRFSPRKCTPSIVKAVLGHLAPEKVPETVATRQEAESLPHVRTAVACLSLLDRIVGLCLSEPTLAKEAMPLVLASLDGIMGWIHFCMDFGLAYRVATPEPTFCLNHYAQVPFKISISNPKNDCGPFSALNHSKKYLQLLIRLWTTPDDRGRGDSFYVAWLNPDICPVLYLLPAVFQDCCGNGPAFVEEVVSHDLGRRFVEATSRRAAQIAHAVTGTRYEEGIKGYAAKLLKLVQSIYQCQDHRLRQYFDDTNYLSALTKMVNRLSRLVPDQQSLSDKLAEPIINLYVHAMYCRSPELNPHRVLVRNFRGLLSGGYLEMHARCLSMGRGNVLKDFSAWSMSPHILDVLVTWEEDGHAAFLEPLFDFPDSRELWSTFWKATQDRVRLYKRFRDDGWSGTCNNIWCAKAASQQYTKTLQCARCSSVTYCSASCQRIDWLERHRSECSLARNEYFEQKEAGTLYSHRSRAFHVRYLEWLCVQRATEIEAAPGVDDTASAEVIPVFDCSGLGDSLKLIKAEDLLSPDSETLEGTSNGFRDSRYEQLARGGGNLAKGIFKHDSGSEIHLLVLLMKSDGGYKASYSTFYIHHAAKEADEEEDSTMSAS